MTQDPTLANQAADVRAATEAIALTSDEVRSAVLRDVAQRLREHRDELLAVNEEEVRSFLGTEAARDRLVLTPARIETMAAACETVADLPCPLGETVARTVRPNGLLVERVRVPLGVVGVIYENRPNVTFDVAALCLKSGNVAFLRGSSSAQRTNARLVALWHDALVGAGLPRAAVTLVADTSHETAAAFMGLTGVIDCLIPRGGPSLIAAMREHARVPYVLDGDGNCHLYVDAAADLDMALAIATNAKTSRPGVCNALETLLVHEAVATTFLPRLAAAIPEVVLRGDDHTCALVPSAQPANEDDYAREFLAPILAVAVVANVTAAIAHIRRYSTGHTETIVTADEATAARFIREVDAAAVVVNASSRFIDGGELGLGGEVGISTQKLHARGPMGLQELTSVKWVVQGKGQIR